MVKLAANLSMMYGELPWADRFGAAARAGFAAVEFQFPYESSPDEIAAALRANRLQCVLFNLPPGDWAAGERGVACVPGREAAFRESVARGLDYALALETPRVHALAGLVPERADRAAYRTCYVNNLRVRRRRAGQVRPDAPDRAAQSPRHARLLSDDAGRGARDPP